MDEWVRADEPRTPTTRSATTRSATTRSATTRSATTRSATDRPPRRAPTAGPATEPTLPADVATEIRRTADAATARHKEVLVERMGEAVASYDRHRYQDALRLGKQVAKEVPTVAAVRRLAGFAAYRLGRWREAIRHLEAYGELAGEVDHVPSLMDCQRALGHPRKVADLWNDLRRRSPDPDVLTEGRIVAVSTLADRGKLGDAIALLTAAGAARALRNPSERHLRQWYVLGDLYERAGDVPQACELFGRVQRAEPEAYDVTVRLEALGRSSGSRRGRARR